jgi:hypothetical protein
MLCGASQVPWEIVSFCATYIHYTSGLNRADGNFHQNAYMMRERGCHKYFAVPALLNWGRQFTTSDPLDRVYALMGMPPFANMKPWEADYRKSKLELYREVTERCILELKDIRAFSYVQHSVEIEDDFPSWVPQWDQKTDIGSINQSVKFDWRTSGESSVSAAFDSTKSVIRIEGIVFDLVDTETEIDIWAWFHSQERVMKSHPMLEYWKSQKSLPTAYITREASMEAYAMTFTAGINIDGQKSIENREDFMSDFSAYIIQLWEVSKDEMSQYPGRKNNVFSKQFIRYEIQAKITCWNRSFFTTKKGYMGIGPNVLEIGDIVCVLFGGDVPYILRPKDGYYQLVGDAYVHGIMEGEAIEQWQAKGSGLEKQVFEIR